MLSERQRRAPVVENGDLGRWHRQTEFSTVGFGVDAVRADHGGRFRQSPWRTAIRFVGLQTVDDAIRAALADTGAPRV